MTFDWSEYLILAQHLMGATAAPSDEALQRCGISRAYYAAFWKARLALDAESPRNPIPNGGAHTQVIRVLQDSTRRDRRKIGIDLERLKEQRIEADYAAASTSVADWSKVATSATITANKILQSLLRAFPSP